MERSTMLLSSVNHLFLWSISHGYVKQPEGNSDPFITSFIFCYTIYSIWLVVAANPSEQYDLVSWDHEIPNWMESYKIPWFQTTNQLWFIIFPLLLVYSLLL